MIETQPYPVEAFDGGLTDNYVDGQNNRYRFADNFVITNNKKLYTRPGSTIYEDVDYLIPAGNQRIGSLMTMNDDLFVQSAKKFYYFNAGYQTLTGPTGNDVYDLGSITSYNTWTTWNNHLLTTNDDFAAPMKIYKDSGDILRVVNAGLPALASTPTVTPVAGALNFLYAFVYFYEYTVGGRTFQDFGPTTIISVGSSADPGVSASSVTAIPVLANGATDNHATAAIKVYIYRTEDAGTAFYKVGEVTNGTTIFSDTQSDSTVTSNLALYTNDGTVSQLPAPKCKYLHATNNYCWYAHVKDGTDILENRVIQSFTYNVDSVGSTFFIDVDDKITGLSSYNFTPIVGCKSSLFRIDGTYADDGSGFVSTQKISDTVGCISNRSFVKTKKGTFFAGNDGFYWTDAFQVVKISDEFNTRYRDFVANDPEKIYGTYDEENDRVLWTVQVDPTNAENDTVYCFDIKFGIREDGAFTTWSGGNSFRPTALYYFNKSILRADSRGYILSHSANLYADPLIDTTKVPSNWAKKTIIYNYESCAYKFGTTFIRKFIPRIVVSCSNETNLSLQINSINDKGKKTSSLRVLSFKNAVIWGDEDVNWGDSAIIWNYDGVIEEQRRFPARGLRCSYKQIQLTNADVTIETSDVSGTATIDSATKQVTLDDASNKDFPSASIGYDISFSFDNYASTYEVIARSADTLTVLDAQNNLPNGSFDWKLTGLPKNQVLNLLGYNLHVAFLSKSQPTFGTSGGNG